MTYEKAILKAKKLAKEGPRVSAVLKFKDYIAVGGYIDKDEDNFQQVALVTPDGRVWIHKE